MLVMNDTYTLLYSMVFIYVLRLTNGKYYVGKTTNPEFRLETHFKSGGSRGQLDINQYRLWKLYQTVTIMTKTNIQKNTWINME